MDNQTAAFPMQPVGNKKNNSPKIIAIIVVAILLAGGFVLFSQRNKSNEPSVAGIENQQPTSIPTPTPEIDKKTVKIQVLNGTGTPGQAASAIDALKEAGYSADNIQTDNADDYDQSVTTIAAKEGFAGIADDVKTALGSQFDNITIDSLPLGSDSEYDIVVTTGGKKYEEPTATPNPTSSPTETPAENSTVTTTPSPTPTSQ